MLQNVGAKNPVGFRVGHKFDDSIEIIIRNCASVSAEWKSPDPIIDPLLFCLVFRQTDTGQFRIRVNDSGDRIIINMAIFAGDPFHTRNSFVFGFVRQHLARDYVTDRVDAVDIRLKMLVDFDPLLFLELNSDFLRAETFAERFPSYGDKNFGGLKF